MELTINDVMFPLRIFAEQADCKDMPKVRLVFASPRDKAQFEATLRLGMTPVDTLNPANKPQQGRYEFCGISTVLLTEDR
jgi:hypothetical protein